MDPIDVAIVQAVSKFALVGEDHLHNYLLRRHPDAFLGPRPPNIGARLARLEAAQYIQNRPVVEAVTQAAPGNAEDVAVRAGNVVVHKCYYVTQRAGTDLNLALPPDIRDNFIEHHFATLKALERIEKEADARGDRVLEMKLEGELIRDNFKGHVFDRRGEVRGKFADAVVTVEHPDGSTEDVNVEYVSSKYTDEQISDKAKNFQGRVVWAVDNSRTAARVQAITDQEPMVL